MFPKILHSEYKYSDDDVDKILQIRLKEENPIERDINTFILHAPIGGSERKFLEFLKEERRNDIHHPNRTLLVPYLDGDHENGHWVGVVLRFQNNIPTTIEYYDSLKRQIPLELTQQLENAYGKDINFTKPEDLITQIDTTSCGPCMIENLINAAKKDHSNKPTSDEIRMKNYEIMKDFTCYDITKFMNRSHISNDLRKCSSDQYYKNLLKKRQNSLSDQYNKKGNECFFNNDFDKAIENFKRVIKCNPYYAIPHHNKRCTENKKRLMHSRTLTGNNDRKLKRNRNSATYQNPTKTDTYFVINTICHARKRSFSDDSSEEDIDDDNMWMLKKIKIETNFFPYIKKAKNHSKQHWKDIKCESIIPNCTNNNTKSRLLDGFFKKLTEKGFEEKDKLSYIRVCVAYNRMKSVSNRKNRSLILELESKVDTDIEYMMFGFFWISNWYDRETGKIIDYDKVKHFYKQLKKYSKPLAKKFLEQEEDDFERNPENIPYQHLREYAKDHSNTKKCVQELRGKNSNANIYLSLIDFDVVDFNHIFSAYLRIFQNCCEIPTVMSTGYEYPLDPGYNHAHKLQSQMDRMIRVVTASCIPLGTYYPEPNMCILIPENCLTIPESFINSSRGNKLESPILLTDMQVKRPLARYIFSDDRPLITSIPDRAKVFKAPRAQNASKINFSPEFISGRFSPSKQDILKKFQQVSQSNFKLHNWYTNLLTNNYFHKYFNENAKNVHKNFIKFTAKMFNAESEETMISAKNELKSFITDSNIIDEIHGAIDERKKIDKYFKEHFERTEEEQEIHKLLQRHNINYNNVSRATILALSTEPMLRLVKEPNETGPVISICELLKLDEDIIRYISDNDQIIEALEDSNIDNDALFNILENDFDDFDLARYSYPIEQILERYEEDPIHLEFMATDDPGEIIYENSDDLEIVNIGLEYYDVDVEDIRNMFKSECALQDFDTIAGRYASESVYEESDEEDTQYL